VYNKYELFKLSYHSNARLKRCSFGSLKIKFSRNLLISLAYQIKCLLISVLFLEPSYAYPAKNLIETGNMTVINGYGIAVNTIKNTTSHTEPFSVQGGM
jgi:hypothetical protein